MVATNLPACTVCHKDLPDDSRARSITGTICRECLCRFGARDGVPLMDFLDKLDMPVLAVDEDVVVSQANKPLLRLLGKDFSQISGRRGGDVFECAHAHLPEGCGRTVHCSGCAIRRAVTETFTTGRSLRNVPAYLDRDLATQVLQLGMSISTEKVWGVVLLRIDYVGPRPEPARPAHRG